MKNLDEKITRRQAMQEQVVVLLRSTTNKVCKTMTSITGTGTISQARRELNDGISGVRGLIRQLENDPTPYESILRTERNELGNFSKDIVCDMYGDKSQECELACLAIEAGDAPGNTFTPDDLKAAWDIFNASVTFITTLVAATTTAEAVDNILNSDCDTDGVFSVSCVCEKYPRINGRKTLECELAENADNRNGTLERTGTFTADDLEATAAEPPFNEETTKVTPDQR